MRRSLSRRNVSAARSHNRIVVLCASINDVSSWPFWKFLQLKKVKGVTDLHMLAFNSEGGSFVARIDGSEYSVKNYEKVVGYHQPMLEEFIDRTYDEGRTFFVYGGHGMGDYLELEEYKVGLQVHELAKIFGHRKYEAILFDACFMANLDCVYYLRNNTKWIGASEGYMWEEDVALDAHIFNTYTASAMSRFRDPKTILETIQRDYCNKTRMGDFSILSTEHVEKLWEFVEKHVWQRVYDSTTFLSSKEHEELQHQAEETLSDVNEPNVDGASLVSTSPSQIFQSGTSRKRRLLRAAQFKHALYPSEYEDKHLVDLRTYLQELADDARMTAPIEGELSGSNPVELLEKVVIQHTPPFMNQIYSSPLGGLSLCVHEFSHLSRSLRRNRVDKTKLNERASTYIEESNARAAARKSQQEKEKTQAKELDQ
ncbi:peptidase, putative [Bodo saltans]|uniref:Peptidase, putative n=1 Tax=Bodo saltans TaxID=75058 RepID=A0A0S4JS52_BODSA|nr:peptidase, putative [Bodo saltans]|eukprot:CUG92806.1 peptidase, putative [Bodo saltans]